MTGADGREEGEGEEIVAVGTAWVDEKLKALEEVLADLKR